MVSAFEILEIHLSRYSDLLYMHTALPLIVPTYLASYFGKKEVKTTRN